MPGKLVSYPHPVIGLRDDVEGELLPFDAEVNCDGASVRIEVRNLKVTNATVQAYIDAGLAAFAIRVHCARTYYRRSWTTTDPALSIELPATTVADEVRIAHRVVAQRDIASYHPQGLHPDYGEARFAIGAGDVLAEGHETSFFLDNDFDPLAGSVSSIMQVRRGDQDHAANVDFQCDKITIRIGKKDFDDYEAVRAGAPAILHSALVMPVLMEAISLVLKDDGSVDGLLWSGRLKSMLQASGSDAGGSLFDAAQRLLKNPLQRTFEEARRHVDA